MSVLDTFNSDFFSTVSLTASLEKLPFVPGFLGGLGIFEQVGIDSRTAVIEERQGRLTLIPTAAPGTMPNSHQGSSKKGTAFPVPYIPLNAAVMASDVSGKRLFGSKNELETVSAVVNQRLLEMRQSMETTFEYHRNGAISGILLDADGTTEIYNFFSDFGTSEQTVDFDFSAATDIKAKCTSVIRNVQTALGNAPFSGLIGLAGDTFWDELIGHADVKAAYSRWNDGQVLFTQQMGGGNFVGNMGQQGFTFGGITFYNYRANIGATPFVATGNCRFVPVGVPGLFQHISAPGTFMEAAGTIGIPMYAKQERMKFDVGVELHVQANPLMICTRPRCLVKGTNT